MHLVGLNTDCKMMYGVYVQRQILLNILTGDHKRSANKERFQASFIHATVLQNRTLDNAKKKCPP